VRVGGWGVIVGYEAEEFLAPVGAAGRVAFGSALGALAVLAGIIVLTSRRITLPLHDLAATASRMATGNLEVPIAAPRTRDEIGHLTTAFIRMRDDLRQHIADLAAATAAKQKLESELAIAQQIQRTMLPAPHHKARGRQTAAITTQMVPAKTVGGDLYTYFSTGGSRFFFAAGDVSDKGVPAALFMARTITLLRTIARDTASPDEILCRVNAELFPDNDECMFVTLFCGVLDLDTGELIGASAGHEPPLLFGDTRGPTLWEIPTGPALGLNSRITVPLARRILEPGDTLVLYTDGVTDAVNPAGMLFTSAGLLQAAGRLAVNTADPAADLLRQVQAFADGAPQPDDITLFALRFD
jgi:phosphoserine phosphatase RsbU/P